MLYSRLMDEVEYRLERLQALESRIDSGLPIILVASLVALYFVESRGTPPWTEVASSFAALFTGSSLVVRFLRKRRHSNRTKVRPALHKYAFRARIAACLTAACIGSINPLGWMVPVAGAALGLVFTAYYEIRWLMSPSLEKQEREVSPL